MGGSNKDGESGDRKESTVQEFLCVTDDAHRFPLASLWAGPYSLSIKMDVVRIHFVVT
jgi:hypothetical protein